MTNIDANNVSLSTQISPDLLIEMCQNLDDDTINLIQERLIDHHPNTYTFTKALTEYLIMLKASELPIAIVRPSIICAAREEPFPGWIDSINGLTGVISQAAIGSISSVFCNENVIIDIIPVDIVVNTLITSSWYIMTQNVNSVKIYNCISGTINPITMGQVRDSIVKHVRECPTKYLIWYPGLSLRRNRLMHKFIVALVHFPRAVISDLVLKMQGNRPKMLKIFNRFNCAMNTTEFFRTQGWKFNTDNMIDLTRCVIESNNSNNFNIDITNLDWDLYMYDYVSGIREYITKEDPATLDEARNRLLKFYWAHKILNVFNILALVTLIISCISCG